MAANPACNWRIFNRCRSCVAMGFLIHMPHVLNFVTDLKR